jgi:hypothetical protein
LAAMRLIMTFAIATTFRRFSGSEILAAPASIFRVASSEKASRLANLLCASSTGGASGTAEGFGGLWALCMPCGCEEGVRDEFR